MRTGWRLWSSAALLVPTLLPACSDGEPDYGELACLDGWPDLPAAAAPLPSLAVTPRIVWSTPLVERYPCEGGVALSADELITGADLQALDLLTGALNPDFSRRFGLYTGGRPSTDTAGRIYFNDLDSLYAVNADGTQLWRAPTSGLYFGGDAPGGCGGNVAVAGESVLLTSASAGLVAFDADGTRSWTSGYFPSMAAGHWGLGWDFTAAYVVDLRTGKPAGRLRTADGHDVIPLVPLAGRGILVADRNCQRILLLDTCGRQVWSVDVPSTTTCGSGPVVVGPGEISYVPMLSGEDSQPTGIVAVNPEGTIAARRDVRSDLPWAVGADGTVYAIDVSGAKLSSRIVALSPTLEELWQLDPGGESRNHWYGTINAVMTSDGVLFTRLATVDGPQAVAIQTTSPGLAASSWPTFRHDNQSSNWAGGQF